MGNITCHTLGKLLDGTAHFKIPLYQRSYVWGKQEINQLLEDLWEAFLSNKSTGTKKYYLGTLVVIQRGENVVEVVDGQQRLTTLTLLFRHLKLIEENPLFFENRPEAARFLDALFRNSKDTILKSEPRLLENPTVKAMASACQHFLDYEENAERYQENDRHPYKSPCDSHLASFLKGNVCLYKITLPERSNIAKYFEVMNNRGVQLADVDVVKSRLMNGYEHDEKVSWGKAFSPQEEFRIRWDLCADFTRRRAAVKTKLEEECQKRDQPRRVDDILQAVQSHVPQEDTVARMDFPNFLLIALSLYKTKKVALDERQLLTMFSREECNNLAKGFLTHLEVVRDCFDDRFIRAELNLQGTIQRWVIAPWKEAESDKRKQLTALEAMLEVSYTSRCHRTWVRDALEFLLHNAPADDAKLIERLEAFVRERVEIYKDHCNNYLEQGANTPHLLLNLLDYLFMLENGEPYVFQHRSSVEHFMPRDQKYSDRWKDAPENAVNYIGNLCLMNTSDNSSLSNHSPEEKVRACQDIKKLGPKQQEMYKTCEWPWKDCQSHHNQCIEKIKTFLLKSSTDSCQSQSVLSKNM